MQILQSVGVDVERVPTSSLMDVVKRCVQEERTLPYDICKELVKDIVLVTDEEIKAAVSTLYQSGFVVEPSGAAAFAAIINNKIPNITGKRVVVVLSGGNIGLELRWVRELFRGNRLQLLGI
uniref:L-serine deaminase n=1 Tax=Scleropages formosus TaxID=113540 RepID=A0A8C9T636_SCLFO